LFQIDEGKMTIENQKKKSMRVANSLRQSHLPQRFCPIYIFLCMWQILGGNSFCHRDFARNFIFCGCGKFLWAISFAT